MKVDVTVSPPVDAAQPGTLQLHECYDLIGLLCVAVLAPVLLLLPEWMALLRVPLGIVLVLLAPGYALQAALFPARDDVDMPIRAALSFGLSVALIPLLALLLDRLPWGIRPLPIAVALALTIVLATMVAMWRRGRLVVSGTAAIPSPPARWMDGRWARGYAFGLVALLMVLGVMLAMMLNPPPERYTEFYALGAQGLAEEYPREVAAGEPIVLQLGITNQEGARVRYRIEVHAGGAVIAQIGPVVVDDGTTWSESIHYALARAGVDQPVDILLFREGDTEAYRQLRLWVNVREIP